MADAAGNLRVMFWKKKKKPDYQHIAELERALGLDDDAILSRRTKKRTLSRPVILSPKTPTSDPAVLELRPGFKWPVSDHDDVRLCNPVCATAVFYRPMHEVKRSSVVLPPGLTLG